MPELPEVETVRRGLAERIVGDRIQSVWLGAKPQTFRSPRRKIAHALQGARIADVRRMGKHLVIDFESRDLQWIIHLGMTGSVQVTQPDAELLKHTHAIIRLASGKEVRFADPRRFGRMWVTSDFQAAGLEPLLVRPDDFVALFRGRKTPIKSALLNQKLLRGVGNIYADESLFRAGIRPRRRAATITREQFGKLHRAVREVLREAIALGGSSISDYVDTNGDEGFFQFQHRVYGREGEPCLVCGSAIQRVVLGGRSSHYCSKCQK
jgi:formamidopyrimidine-DNA glycosylase